MRRFALTLTLAAAVARLRLPHVRAGARTGAGPVRRCAARRGGRVAAGRAHGRADRTGRCRCGDGRARDRRSRSRRGRSARGRYRRRSRRLARERRRQHRRAHGGADGDARRTRASSASGRVGLSTEGDRKNDRKDRDVGREQRRLRPSTAAERPSGSRSGRLTPDHPEPSISVYTETADRGQSISYPAARTDVFILNDVGRTVDVYRNRSDG